MNRPFNEAKYKALLEGLEVSEVSLKYVKNNNFVFRLDSNYFKKEFLLEESIIQDKKHSTIKELNIDIKSFGAYSLNNDVQYLERGIPFIRGVNMKKGRVSFNDMIYIDDQANSLLWKSEIKPEMVLLSMSGTIGDVAMASKTWKYPINSNQDVAKIDTNGAINPYYLYAFLLSKFGQNYLKREARGSVQQHVFLSQIEEFKIPLFDNKFTNKIQSTIDKSDEKLFYANQIYTQAETLLLKSLGLKNFQPGKESVNVKSFKESFLSTGRLDAEYYQPEYEDYLKLIRNYSKGSRQLAIVCNLKDKNFNPKNNMKYKYIELSNIGKSGEITSCTMGTSAELPSRARRKVKANDVIVSSIEGSLESCALVTEEYDDALCSTGFYVINSKKINAETLLVLFKSEPMQNILKQHCSGTILTAINKDEFLNMPVPLIDEAIQTSIKSKVNKSMEMRHQSEHLLEVAKRAVEIAIEQDEQKAMEYIIKGCHEYTNS